MKRFLSMILALAMLLGLSACGGKAESQTGAPAPASGVQTEGGTQTAFGLEPLPERTTLRIGFFSGAPHSLPWYIADKEGYFDELNMDVEYQSFINGPAMMEASSSWDIGSVGSAGVLVGQLGYDVKMLGTVDMDPNIALFVRTDSPIYQHGQGHISENPDLYGTPEDWKGTQWLYPAGTSLQQVLSAALEGQGLTLGDVESVNMDVTTALTAFKGGQGDGLAVWSSTAFEAEDAGFIRIADSGTLDVIGGCGIVVTKDAMENKFDAIVKAWEVYYLTWQRFKQSDENYAKAEDYFFESCENEGTATTKEMSDRSLATLRCPATVKLALSYMLDGEEDAAGKYTKRPLCPSENHLLSTLDFFISEQKYTEEDRNTILDHHLVDPSVAQAAKEDLEKLNIAIE